MLCEPDKETFTHLLLVLSIIMKWNKYLYNEYYLCEVCFQT